MTTNFAEEIDQIYEYHKNEQQKIKTNMYQITKQFKGYPFAHRQPNHDGHCKLIHGHNWDFEICLEGEKLDENGFVYDFGKFKWLKEWFTHMFDHTLVLNEDDPELSYFKRVLAPVVSETSFARNSFADIRTVPSCSCEGLAELIFNEINTRLKGQTSRVRLVSVKVYEDEKNTAIYTKGGDD